MGKTKNFNLIFRLNSSYFRSQKQKQNKKAIFYERKTLDEKSYFETISKKLHLAKFSYVCLE